ncbi:MAG: type II secretion system protein N [Proteobacteria bacterium]|nr:type II secretion system protein N [Pseudomonadota bacterium]MBU1716970.1 type II secretion system protein N [Pseudomonadota bacterium]
MKKFSKRYIVFGFTAYLFFLALSFPADRAWSIAEKRLGPSSALPQVSGISGVWWSGRVDEVRFNAIELRNLRWTFRPLALVRGMVKAVVAFEPPGGNFAGVIAVGRKTIELTKVKAKVPFDQLNDILTVFGVQVGGFLVADLQKIILVDKSLLLADGLLVWQDALVERPQKLILGELKAALSTEKEGVRAVISDSGGPLVAEGISTLDSAGLYSLAVKLASRDSAQPDLADAIKLLGTPGGDGKVSLSYNGKLPEF